MFPLNTVLLVMCAGSLLADRYHPDLEDGALGRGPVGVGGRAASAEREAAYWYREARAGIQRRQRHHADRRVAKNVVMFLGDGMSVPTLAAARALLGQREGRSGEEAELSFEAFPTVGLSKTYCVNRQVPDSACTGTAYLCGVKNNYGTLGVTAAVPRLDCLASLDNSTHLESIAAWALQAGKSAGVVTTTRITHASPAAAYARAAERGWEHDALVHEAGFATADCPDIAHQLVHAYPGKHFKVILGGGRRNFRPTTVRDEEGTRGRRTDDRDLIQEWQDDKAARNLSYAYAWNREQLIQQLANPPEYLLGLFEGSHLQYNLESDKTTEPTLTELTELAIKSLSRNENGFFLFVEAGRIDHAHHENLVHLALDETIELSKAVQRATELLEEDDSLIVVTADHAHVMTFSGYPQRGSDILGPSGYVGLDDVPYMSLSYANGPGARPNANGARANVLLDSNFGDTQWASHAEVPLASETHGGDDVAVFARGPHHALFSGLYEQSQIPHLMAYAGCFGANVDLQLHCSTPDNSDA